VPLYAYRCANKHETLKVLRVKDYEEAVDCDQCSLAAVRVWTAPVMVKVQPDICYDSPIDKRPITSHAARREDMKRNGCIEYDPEMHKDAARRRQEEDDALDASVDETVHRAVAKLPKAKKDQLIKEVVNKGVTAEVVRV
jgi:hypothetical protein